MFIFRFYGSRDKQTGCHSAEGAHRGAHPGHPWLTSLGLSVPSLLKLTLPHHPSHPLPNSLSLSHFALPDEEKSVFSKTCRNKFSHVAWSSWIFSSQPGFVYLSWFVMKIPSSALYIVKLQNTAPCLVTLLKSCLWSIHHMQNEYFRRVYYWVCSIAE